MIKIIPAIDLIEGRCVRLTKGDYGQKKVYDGSPLEVARRFADAGVSRIHLVDLDGAKAGAPQNLKVLEGIASAVSCELEWGGGIGSSEALQAVFDAVENAKRCSDRPNMIVARTVKGRGWKRIEGTTGSHSRAVSAEDLEEVLRDLA